MMFRNNRKGQELMGIFLPMIVICILGVALAIIVSDVGPRYNVSYDDSSYSRIVNQSGAINRISDQSANSLMGEDNQRSNVLTSTERLITGAYNSILVLGSIPGIYMSLIGVVADTLGIPSAIINLVIAGILFSIVGVVMYLALGRR
jgi:hypothetical protein